MTFQEQLIANYAALFNGRMYFDVLPEGWTPAQMAEPFCIIDSSQGGEERRYADNSLHEFSNAVVRFFIWGARRDEVAAKARALTLAVAASSTSDFVTVSVAAASSDYDSGTKLRGSQQSFGFWYKEP